MSTPPAIPDPISALTALFALVFGAPVAHTVSPYAVIVLAAFVGGGWALSRKEERTRLQAARFFGLVIGTAVLLSVGMAELLNRYLQIENINWLVAPIALLIGGIGDDWPNVLRRIARSAEGVITRKQGDRNAN